MIFEERKQSLSIITFSIQIIMTISLLNICQFQKIALEVPCQCDQEKHWNTENLQKLSNYVQRK